MKKEEIYISFITDKLKAGEFDAKKIVSIFCSKFHKTTRTFFTHWKIANERYKSEREVINKLKSDEYKALELSAVKSLVLTKDEKQEILTKIIKGELLIEKLVIVKGEVKKVFAKPDAMDIMKAIDLDNKMAGHFAPISSNVAVVTAIKIIRE